MNKAPQTSPTVLAADRIHESIGELRLMARLALARIEGAWQPVHAIVINFHHIKAAWGQSTNAQQVVLRGTYYAFLFYPSDTGRCAAMAGAQALTHLHKHQRTVGSTHHQVNLTAAAPWCPIIARQQSQAPVLQKLQGFVLGGIADFFAARLRAWRPKETLA